MQTRSSAESVAPRLRIEMFSLSSLRLGKPMPTPRRRSTAVRAEYNRGVRPVLMPLLSPDPRLAMLHLANAISSMTTSLAPAPPLAPSCHPLYSSLQLLLTLQLHAHAFDRAETTASLALAGAERLFPSGSGSGSSSSGGHHPVLALLRTTHARLVTTPPASDPAHPEGEMQYWMATGARAHGVERLVGALRAVESAFGDGSCGEGSGPRGRGGEKGGEMAKMLRVLIRDQEEGIEMGRRMRAAAAAQQ